MSIAVTALLSDPIRPIKAQRMDEAYDRSLMAYWGEPLMKNAELKYVRADHRHNIRMNERDHAYYIHNIETSQERMAKVSVTGLKEMFVPEFNIVNVIEKMFRFNKSRVQNADGDVCIQTKGKYANSSWFDIYARFSTGSPISAAAIGTHWHYHIEQYIRKQAKCTNYGSMSMEDKCKHFLLPHIESPTVPDLNALTGEIERKETPFTLRQAELFISNYEKYILQEKWHPFALEAQIYNINVAGCMAGTVDAIFKRRIGDKVEHLVVDWKTMSKKATVSHGHRALFPFSDRVDNKQFHFSLQLNLYASWLNDFYGLNVTRMQVFGFDLFKKTFERVEIPSEPTTIRKVMEFYMEFLFRETMYQELDGRLKFVSRGGVDDKIRDLLPAEGFMAAEKGKFPAYEEIS